MGLLTRWKLKRLMKKSTKTEYHVPEYYSAKGINYNFPDRVQDFKSGKIDEKEFLRTEGCHMLTYFYDWLPEDGWLGKELQDMQESVEMIEEELQNLRDESVLIIKLAAHEIGLSRDLAHAHMARWLHLGMVSMEYSALKTYLKDVTPPDLWELLQMALEYVDMDDYLSWLRQRNTKKEAVAPKQEQLEQFAAEYNMYKSDDEEYKRWIGEQIASLDEIADKYADIARKVTDGTIRKADGTAAKIPKSMEGLSGVCGKFAEASGKMSAVVGAGNGTGRD